MSRTDKTTPYRVVDARGDCRCRGYPCRHLSITSALAFYRRKQQRAERTRLRTDLARGVEPVGRQHRHGALWDAV